MRNFNDKMIFSKDIARLKYIYSILFHFQTNEKKLVPARVIRTSAASFIHNTSIPNEKLNINSHSRAQNRDMVKLVEFSLTEVICVTYRKRSNQYTRPSYRLYYRASHKLPNDGYKRK